MCNCKNDEIDIYNNELWIEDCEGINRKYKINFCPLCGENLQPERLSPEDAIIPAYYGSKFCGGCKEENCVCDSPTPDNKENQGDVEKSTSAKCAKCDWPPNDGKRRIYCMCGQ